MGFFRRKRLEGKTAQEWYELATLEINPEMKVKHYSKCLEIDSYRADAWCNLGSALTNLKRYEEAMNCYDKALKTRLTHAIVPIWSWHGKGKVLKDLGRLEEALTSFDKALELNPEGAKAFHVGVWSDKGDTLRNLGRYEEAIGCYEKALEINPQSFFSAFTPSKIGIDMLNLDRMMETTPPLSLYLNLALSWIESGNALRNLRRCEEAIECYDKALGVYPPLSNVCWFEKGVTFNYLKRYEEAIRCFDEALKINPEDGSAKNNKKIAEERLRQEKEK